MRFSIIIPVYNVVGYLDDCLQSLLMQRYDGWEAICVDDGSSDGSPALLDSYSKRDKRIKVFHKANGGVSSARNFGIDKASGEFLVMLDADDVLDREYLKTAHECFLQNPQCDAILGSVQNFSDSFKSSKDVDKRVALLDFSNDISSLFQWRGLNCFRRTKVSAVRYRDLLFGEDWLYCYECSRIMRIVALSRVCVYGYRTRVGSAMSTKTSVRGLVSTVQWRAVILKLLEGDKRRLPNGFYKWILPGVLYGFATKYFSLGKLERKQVWPEWRKCVKGLRRVRTVPLTIRFRLRIVLCFNSDVILFFMALSKDLLRSKGVSIYRAKEIFKRICG